MFVMNLGAGGECVLVLRLHTNTVKKRISACVCGLLEKLVKILKKSCDVLPALQEGDFKLPVK